MLCVLEFVKERNCYALVAALDCERRRPSCSLSLRLRFSDQWFRFRLVCGDHHRHRQCDARIVSQVCNLPAIDPYARAVCLRHRCDRALVLKQTRPGIFSYGVQARSYRGTDPGTDPDAARVLYIGKEAELAGVVLLSVHRFVLETLPRTGGLEGSRLCAPFWIPDRKAC